MDHYIGMYRLEARAAQVMLFVFCWCGSSSVSSSEPQPTAALARRWQALATAGDKLVSRELFWFADAALENGSHAAQVEQAYAWAEQMQDRDPASATFGNFRWYRFNERPEDLNAVEFCMSTATVTWIHYRDQMTPPARMALERLMRFGAEGLKRHNVGPGYTNIYLEKCWNLIGVGQALNDATLCGEGQDLLGQWITFTCRNGITEYLSGTYYGVSFEPLEKIAQFAKDPDSRENANAGLRLLWTDVAANWFAPCRRLGGACSREYNFQVGINAPLQKRLAGAYSGNSSQYVPPIGDDHPWKGVDTIRSLTETVPRTVRQRWGNNAACTATQYVSHHFSIGSAGANYGPMDRPLTVNIAGPDRDRLPFVTFLMDARDDAYCRKPFRMPNGHSKARHLSPFLTTVQNGPEVLLLASDDPQRWKGGYKYENLVATCLQSHLTFPVSAEIWVGAEKLNSPNRTFEQIVPADTPVFLRYHGVTVAIRAVLATSGDQRTVPVQLVCDPDGLRYGVMRMTWVHANGPPTARATVALWVAATETEDPSSLGQFQQCLAAPVTAEVAGQRVHVSVPGLARKLDITADVSREIVLTRSGGEKLGEGLLVVNGIDLGKRLLAASPAVRKLHELTAHLVRDAEAGKVPLLRLNSPVEAEKAALIEGSLVTEADQSASGRAYLVKPAEITPSAGGRAVWIMDVPRDGNYFLWARVRAPSKTQDSFYLRLTQDPCHDLAATAWHTGVHPGWRWVRIPAASFIALSGGHALLEIRGRESGTMLDAVAFTADSNWQPAPSK